jgi:hypothetical protein
MARFFAEWGKAMHPPPNPSEKGAGQGAPISSQVSTTNAAEFKSEPLDLQARKLRGLFCFCHATACTIAALAFTGGPR